MEINNNKKYPIYNNISQTGTRSVSKSAQESKDISDCPNPAEYLGRSQIKFRGKSEEQIPTRKLLPKMSKEELKPIVLKKNELVPKEKAIEILKEFGCSDEEISQIDLNNEKIIAKISGANELINTDLYKPEKQKILEGVRNSDTKERLQLFTENLDDEAFLYSNQENISKLSKFIDVSSSDNVYSAMNNILDSSCKDELLEQIPLMYYVNGPLESHQIRSYYTGKNVTYERADILRRINNILPEADRMPIAQCDSLGNDEDLTPENVDKFLTLLSKYGNKEYFNIKSLKFTYDGKNLKELTDSIENVDKVLEKYPMNLDTTYKFSLKDLENLTKQDDIEDVQRYVNLLSKEAKHDAILRIPNGDYGLSKSQLANLTNTLYDKDYGKVNLSEFFKYLDEIKEDKSLDKDGFISLVEAYKGTNKLNTTYINEPLNIGNKDYKGAVEVVKLKKELDEQNIGIADYFFYEILNDDKTDFTNLNKMMNLIKDKKLRYYDYDGYLLKDSKGYNKLYLDLDIGKSFYGKEKEKIYSLAEMLNNQEELDYAIGLYKQKIYPNDENYYESRFNHDIDSIKELMLAYQDDKEATNTILNLKNEKRGVWQFRSKDDILGAIDAYKIDKDFMFRLLNGERKIYNGIDIKSLVEAGQIDKEYVLKLLNTKKENPTDRYPYRFSLDAIQSIIESAQIDKDFTNYLIDLKYTDSYGNESYRMSDSKDYMYFTQKAQEDKEFVKTLFDMTQTNYNQEINRLSTGTIKQILDNPKENREFLLEKINQKENVYGQERYKYYDYEIETIAEATKNDKDLMEYLIDSKYIYEDLYGKEEVVRFNSLSDINLIVKASQINKDFTKELLGYTEAKNHYENYPRFEAQDIIQILELSKSEDINEIRDLINTTQNIKGCDIKVPRYSSYDIVSILKLNKKDKETTKSLLNETYQLDDGKTYPLYCAEDISYILQSYSVDKEKTDMLLTRNKKLASTLQLGGNDILNLTKSAQINKDLTNKLLNWTYISNGQEYNRFDSNDITYLVENKFDDEDFMFELAGMTKKSKSNKQSYRFRASEIFRLMEAAKIDKPFVKELLDIKDSENNDRPLESNEIEGIVNNISFEDYKKLKTKLGNVEFSTANDIIVASQFQDLYQVNNINEIPQSLKKNLVQQLVANNSNLFNVSDKLKELFPLIPTNQDEYCKTLPALVCSLGIETNELKEKDIEKFNNNISELSTTLQSLSDSEIDDAQISQEYSRDEFINDVLNKLDGANLDKKEKQKVFDYYGFELHKNPHNSIGYSIVGYPVNLNNGKKLAQIDDPKTRAVVEDLRKNVIKFSENNKISSTDKHVQKLLNDIINVLPELRTMIGKSDNNGVDMFKQSLKVMQNISKNPEFTNLKESDKKIILIGALMHNIAKAEGCDDKMNAKESSFDTFFIAKKFNLAKDEEIKLYTLIKNQDWLNTITEEVLDDRKIKAMQSVAFDLQQNNNFEMSKILAEANIMTLGAEQSELKEQLQTSLVDSVPKIQDFAATLKKSQPLLPVTKMPKASTIEKAITYVDSDGRTNLKGVYKDKNGMVVVKFNEVEDWEALGLPKGSTSKGIMAKAIENINGQHVETETETGNIKFFVHGLDYSNQLAKFDAFALPNSDVLLSVSYAERPETKYRFFRPQGIMLDVPSDYVYGGGNTDSGSGCGKFIEQFKDGYVFGGYRENDRLYISELIKEETGMTDEEYVKMFENNKDKPMTEIEPKDLQEKIIKKLATINSNHRKFNRAYNEMYISNPKEVMGVFAYEMGESAKIEEPLKFLDDNNVRTEFLKKYALEHDVPFYVFGD